MNKEKEPCETLAYKIAILVIVMHVCFCLLDLVSYCQADQKDQAISKAIEAAKIQTGLASYENKLRKYSEDQAIRFVTKAGLKDPLSAGLFCAKLAREKSISFKINNEQITLGMNKAEVRIAF